MTLCVISFLVYDKLVVYMLILAFEIKATIFRLIFVHLLSILTLTFVKPDDYTMANPLMFILQVNLDLSSIGP